MKPETPQPYVGVNWLPVIFIHLVFVVSAFGYFVSVAPQTQLFENLMCDAHYRSSAPGTRSDHRGGSSQNPCKATAVQESLAMLFGFQAMFDGLPGMLLALPYGVAADKIGRRPVLFLSLVGQTLSSIWVLFICWYSLPLRLVWLSSAFIIIGGGSTVAAAVCMMVIADAASEKDRSKLFFSLQSSFILMEIIGPPLGSLMMEKHIWTPILLGLLCSLLSTCLALAVPETLIKKACSKRSNADVHAQPKKTRGAWEAANSWASHCFGTIQFIIRDTQVALLVLSFLVVDFARQSLALLLQYVSERYGWPLSKASYLLSFRASAQLFLFMLVLPAVDTCLVRKTGWPAKTKDFRLARLSIWAITISFIAFAFAPNVGVIVLGLTLYTLGTGFNTFARSLVSALVEPNMIGTLYTTLSIMDTTGTLLAGPLVAESFKWGMRIGGVWHGLPYMLSLMLCGVGAFLLSQIHLREVIEEAEEGEDAVLSRHYLEDSF